MIQENVMWETWIGMKVIKRSNKPFKSTQKIGVVTEYTINPYSDKKGFKIDNDTIVDCHQVKLILE